MNPPQHLLIINPSRCHNEDAIFSQFPMLPKELRLRIWTCSLERHRLIEVKVDYSPASGRARPYSTTNELNKLISGQNYTATVRALQLHSKLLRVNSESRKEALRFYRVHIPCHLQLSKESAKLDAASATEAVLYFNPEYDFVRLVTETSVTHRIADFLHDLRAYDPKDMGLLNLALDSNGMSLGLSPLADISEVHAKASVISSLSRLREIIWVAQSHLGRKINGIGNGIPSFGVRFNHSMPIKAMTPSFDLLSRDPRPVGPELKYVLTGASDPRWMRVQLQEILRKLGIRRSQPVRERVLFAYEPMLYEQQIYDNKTANTFLNKEQESWLEAQYFRKQFTIKCAGKIPVEGPEELAKAVRPAVGFWLFPAEALGPLEGELHHMKRMFDMTSFWPELALSNIS